MARTPLLLLTLGLLALGAAPAQAVTCGELQDALDAAAPGATVTVDEGATCTGHYDLPAGTPITLRGGGTGATFDGRGVTQILSGSDVGATEITNLTFRDGQVFGNGGAIRLWGDSPVTIDHNTFLGNAAALGEGGGAGGAVSIDEYRSFQEKVALARIAETAPAVTIRDNAFGDGSDAGANAADDDGGALALYAVDPIVLAGNRFLGNFAGSYGGGADVTGCDAITATGNRFAANGLGDNPVSQSSGNDRYGGGLAVSGCEVLSLARSRARWATPRDASAEPQLQQSGNVFDANTIAGSGRLQGGGEYVGDLETRSTNDRFTRNMITSSGDPEVRPVVQGGGLSVYAYPSPRPFEGRNLVAAGNSITLAPKAGAAARGGGVYIGRLGAELTLYDSTIAGNSAPAGSGLSGAGSDALKLRNTIVAVNEPADGQVALFGSTDSRSSLLCDGVVPADGSRDANANFCSDPLLVDPRGGEVHQTESSPSRNAGDDSLVPADLTQDYEGDARSAEGRVDIGADEFLARAVIPPPVSTPAATSPAPGQAVSPVAIRKCVSRREFRIRLRVPHGRHATSALVKVVGTRVAVTVRKKRLTAPVVLRGLPKGTFSVKITLHLRGGKRVAGTRVYHTCTQKRSGSVPQL